MLNTVDICFPVSKNMVRYIRDTLNAYKANLVVNYLGTVDMGEHICTRNRNDEFVIVSCAIVSPIKRIDLIAKALLQIEGRRIRWVHFGGGDDEFIKVKEIANYFLPNISAEFPGTVNHDTIINFYAENDVHLFINSSSTEGIPVSVMEAMSFGIPAVATDVGGTSELVDNGLNGILLDADITCDEIATAIKQIQSTDNEKYYAMRAAARKKWDEHFNGKRNFEKLFDTIVALCDQ